MPRRTAPRTLRTAISRSGPSSRKVTPTLPVLLHPLALLLLVAPLQAHGGSYPAPPGPSTPGGSAPGPTTGAAPGGGGSGWSQWWALGRGRYLDLEDGPGTGGASRSGGPFLGQGERSAGRAPRDASPDQARAALAPLLSGLASRDVDRRTASLIALARIGRRHPELAGPLGPRLTELLADPVAEVHESAALALGLLGRPAAAPDLAGLLHDSPTARELSGRAAVPTRTRAFAAHGLGLLALGEAPASVRRFAVHHLVRHLEQGEPPLDSAVAAVIALGRLPLPDDGGGLPAAGTAPGPVAHLGQQLGFLLHRLEEEGSGAADGRVRAQVPVALARLARHTPGRVPALVARLLPHLERDRVRELAVPHGTLLALGLLGTDGARDDALREALVGLQDSAQGMERGLARLTLARCLARRGPGEPDGDRERLVADLRRSLARGSSEQRGWSALALGVLGRELAPRPLPPEVAEDLRRALDERRSPHEQGALALALGLLRDPASRDLLESLLADGPPDLRPRAAEALGLLGDPASIGPLRRALAGASLRPILTVECCLALRQLGDRGAVPGLLDTLRDHPLLSARVSAAAGLTWLADGTCVETLAEVVADDRRDDTTRAFAAVVLGRALGEPGLPWSLELSMDLVWFEAPASLVDPLGGSGVCDLF